MSEPCAGAVPDHLLDLQLRVARRADELARTEPDARRDLEWWLLAEREVFPAAPTTSTPEQSVG